MKSEISNFLLFVSFAISLVILAIVHNSSNNQCTAIVDTSFDTRALENWCGSPVGKIRMIGAWKYDSNTLEDEAGNLWSYEGLEDNGFFLIWLDDMGTDKLEDDTIVKVWQEIYES